MRRAVSGLAAGLALLCAVPRPSASVTPQGSARCASREALRRPFFGDSHVHTALSMDAWGQGTRAGPRDAYRFAMGEPIGIQPYDAAGRALAQARLRRPLDWAVVTDHSELLGETRICQTPGAEGYDSLVCRILRRWPGLGYALINGHVYSSERPSRYSFCGPDGQRCLDAARDPWREIEEAAAEYQDRSAACRFSTFVGYEWTGMPGGRNLHRNVIFRSEVVPPRPVTYIETQTPEALLRALERECVRALPGCDVVSIPHNSNVSGGLMFGAERLDGTPLSPEDAALRARLERLVEVTQHKGDSECRVGGSDELCGFETLAFETLADMAQPRNWGVPVPRGSYVREALVDGLALEARLGANPFRFGLIGSTDTHFATPGMADEDRHLGHAAGTLSARFGIPDFPDLPFFNPGGLAVLWAEENSREALFDAMRRREAYGTSGPRIQVRFFGGFGLDAELCDARDFAARGYAEGVPMGGELAVPEGASADALRFAVWALRDPGDGGVPTTPLQRIEIVKGWVEDGDPREQVLTVAGGRGEGAGVDLATCEPRGEGHDQLCSVWEDTGFDPERRAVYYARVVENPSCRWSQYVCNRAGVACGEHVPRGFEACCDPSVPKTIQERAWTSPIWVSPADPNAGDRK